MRLSAALSRLRPSPTVAISARAQALKAAGKDVIALSAGEPDFDTPAHIQDAARAAMARGATRYAPPAGLPELRRAVADKLRRENGLSYPVEQIAVAAGGKQAIFNAFGATLDPGAEVVIPAPYWVSYPDITGFFGATPVFVPCPAAHDFKLTPDALRAALTPRSRWLVLNTPGNPSGAGYSAQELAALSEVLAAHPDILILCDDIYEHIAYPPFRFATLAQAAPQLAGRCLIVNGVSKAYAMTGWRIGYAAGPGWLIDAMTTLQSQSVTAACTISQWAAVAALEGPQDYIATAQTAFARRRDKVVAALNAAPHLDCPTPQGAFYVFPSCESAIGATSAQGRPITDDAAFADALLEEAGVALAPGSAFGLSPHLRLSYAASDAELARACARISAFCAQLG